MPVDVATPSAARRWCLLTLAALWIGGFTVYAVLVVHVAASVNESHTPGGFVTRQVTWWLNWLAVALAVVLAREWLARRGAKGWRGRARWGFVASLVALAALFALHPWVDSHLDPVAREVRDGDAFYIAHRVYLWVAAVHWLGTVWFVLSVVEDWMRRDGKTP